MKPKHNGLTILIIFVVTGLGILSYSIILANQTIGSIRITRPTTAKDINVPDSPTMAYINFLLPQLPEIAATQDCLLGVNLAFFGYSPELRQNNQTPEASSPKGNSNLQSDDMNTLPYVLTLSFTSKKKNFCLIDGILYKENNTLPDGARILKIETGRVFIASKQTRQWIYSQSQ